MREPAPPYAGEGPHALWHVSENAAIVRFAPHVSETAEEREPLVWAVDTRHLPLYWFPRQCPRGTFWADSATGLLLKARMINERKETVEQFTFTQVSIGGDVDREALKPNYDAQDPGWKRDSSGIAEAAATDSGWIVGSFPAGFRKIMETKRKLPGRPTPVSHIVYSDGLAAISIFIEPLGANARPVHGVSHQGAINIYSRPVADHMVTVLGEAPSATVVQMGRSVSAK